MENLVRIRMNPILQPVWAKCAVCLLNKQIIIEFKVNNTAAHRLCSDQCFTAYKYVNNISPDQCTSCKKYFQRKQSKHFTIYENTKTRCFCSKSCMDVFISSSRLLVPCSWCKKYNFDMIEHPHPSELVVMMCSLNCLNLYKMGVNVVSSQRLTPLMPLDNQAGRLAGPDIFGQVESLTQQHGQPAPAPLDAAPPDPLLLPVKRRRVRAPPPEPPPAPPPAPETSHEPQLNDGDATRRGRGKGRAVRTRGGSRAAATLGRGGAAESPQVQTIGQPAPAPLDAAPPDPLLLPVKRRRVRAPPPEPPPAPPPAPETSHEPQLNPKSLADELASKAQDAQNRAELTSDQRRPDATKSKKGKRKRRDHEIGTAAVDGRERDDSGSETEAECWARPRNVCEYLAALDGPAAAAAEAVHRAAAAADAALRAMAGPADGELLTFDWSSDPDHFEGVRETFTGPAGPTFDVTGLSPLEVFKKIWDDDIVGDIVRETDRYAHQIKVETASKINSRMSRWRDTTGEEIWRFLAIIMLQSLVVNNAERDYWYPGIEQLRIGAFGKIMSFNRFVLLKKCLHFVDNASLPENPSKLDKVMPVVEHLNKKFSALYLPEQTVAVDETLLLWTGRPAAERSITTKRARGAIKSYELYESRTGYLWGMGVYKSKGPARGPAPREAGEAHEPGGEPESATAQLLHKLINLMRPLFGRGHTIVMDNFCNAPLLSRLLKSKHKTDTMGPLRLYREFVPEALQDKNKTNMSTDEVCFSTTKDLTVVVWKDKIVVPMISTFHRVQVDRIEKYRYLRYKPKVVLDYNFSMGGVDKKDEMLSAYPIERVANTCWYKRLFRRLVNVSIHNALVVYNHGRTQQTRLGNRDFRLQLVREVLQVYSPRALARPESPPPAAPPQQQLHLPAKNRKVQRCKLCYEARVRRTTVWRCGACQVNLCIEGCYTAYHAKYVCKTTSSQESGAAV